VVHRTSNQAGPYRVLTDKRGRAAGGRREGRAAQVGPGGGPPREGRGKGAIQQRSAASQGPPRALTLDGTGSFVNGEKRCWNV
jgi:hypothetical protein